MRTNYVLIDYENVQPEALSALDVEHCRVMVFVGAGQTKLSFETVAALQRMGSKADYVKISGNGSNALDFHIAYYIGALAAKDPTASFHIISKDTGFDPLIAHLKTHHIHASRAKDVSNLPITKATRAEIAPTPPLPAPQTGTKPPPAPKATVPRVNTEDRTKFVLGKLQKPKMTRPRTVKTLASAMASFFPKQKLSEAETAAVISGLTAKGFISVADGKVTYRI